MSIRDGRPNVAMIATRGKTRWGLPKGAITRGETQEQAALREVWEETGLHGQIVVHLDRIEYQFRAAGELVIKRVDFYFMRFDGGELRPQLSEVDDVAWVELDDAIGRASFESERRLLTKLKQMWLALEPHEQAVFVR